MLVRSIVPGRKSALGLTRLYRLIDFIGRWSMIDIFMLSILVGLVQFGQITSIAACPGASYFAAVVVLTMFAVARFDPRLMWGATENVLPSLRGRSVYA
jgi:paraquat-inducible protein A